MPNLMVMHARWGWFDVKTNDRPVPTADVDLPEITSKTVVLHLVPQSLNRGAQIYAANLRDHLHGDDEQHHLLVSLFRGPAGRVRPDISLGVPTGLLRRVLDPRAAFALRRLIKGMKADLVVAHGGEALKYAAVAGGAKLVYKRTGLSSSEINRPGRARLYGVLSRRAQRVVGVSKELLEQTHALLRVPQERLVYIPNSRNPDVYRPLREDEHALDERRILFVGQLEKGKRPGLFLDVVEALRNHGYEFQAAIVGDGKLRNALAQRADELGVALLGVRTDVPELLRQSAVVVMTSAPGTEGMPGVLIEAGLSGIPVVSTRAAGVADVVEQGVTGWVVDVDDPGTIAEHVASLLVDDQLRAEQGSAARDRCLGLFSISATAQQWRRLVADISLT